MNEPTGVISNKNFELVDVTMRDGALGRKFPYSLDQLKEYLRLLRALGVKYAEVGFIGGPGKWAEGEVGSPNYDITPELNELLHRESPLKLWSMIDSDNPRLKSEQVHTNKESLVRLTADLDKKRFLQEKIDICKQKDIPFSVNLKHTGGYELEQIQSMAAFAQDQGATIFYIVDTSGTMIPSRVAQITRQLKSILSIDLGFHGHDSMGFAAANSLTAIEEGCKYIDVSLCGIGAGGGNAITETFLLLTRGEQCDWDKLAEAGKLLNISPEYQELQQRIFWGFIGCNSTVKNDLMNNPEAEVAKKAMEWKYGRNTKQG
jgi:4-hydroxy 2-oxovalerate aldolase